MGRLTTELIHESLSYLNPLKQRELDLRGHRIPAIENMGAANTHDAIDFTDNDIHVLGNFPLLPRITNLMLSRNKVAIIQPSLPDSIPHLTMLNLSFNNISELSDLDVLAGFKRLTHLYLIDNPVTKKENYRLWVIWRCPSVRFFDFQKVKDAERKEAKELFGTHENPTDLAQKIMGVKSKTFDLGGSANNSAEKTKTSKISQLKLTDEEKKKLADIVKNATSMDEITRLEKDFMAGRLPAGILAGEGDAMEE